MTTNSPQNSIAPFVATSTYFPEKFDEFRAIFLQTYRSIANAVNAREIAIFDLTEYLTGEQWYTDGDPQKKRQTFRKVYSIGAVAAGATLNTAHGLSGVTAYTKIVGTAVTAAPDFRPIPYASATAVNTQIEIRVDSTNIIIVNGAAAPNISSAIVILEYLKN